MLLPLGDTTIDIGRNGYHGNRLGFSSVSGHVEIK